MSKIQLDTTKSPAVTFATLPCGTVLACEPDGSRIIGVAGTSGRDGKTARCTGPLVDRDVLAFVAKHAAYHRWVR